MEKTIEPATIWQRFFAVLLDFIFFCIIFFPVTRIVKGVWLMGASDHRWAKGLFITDPLCIAFLIFMFLYFVLLEAFWGKTLGKMALGIKVINSAGKAPGIKKALTRNALRVVDSLPSFNILAIILILATKENRRFGDIMAKTLVIKDK